MIIITYLCVNVFTLSQFVFLDNFHYLSFPIPHFSPTTHEGLNNFTLLLLRIARHRAKGKTKIAIFFVDELFKDIETYPKKKEHSTSFPNQSLLHNVLLLLIQISLFR